MSTDETRGTIPPQAWIPHPVSDHGDLDRPDPSYGEGLRGAAKSEFEAALAARKPAEEKPKPKRRRSRRKKS